MGRRIQAHWLAGIVEAGSRAQLDEPHCLCRVEFDGRVNFDGCVKLDVGGWRRRGESRRRAFGCVVRRWRKAFHE